MPREVFQRNGYSWKDLKDKRYRSGVVQLIDSKDVPLSERMDESELSHNLTGMNNELLALLVAQLGEVRAMGQGKLYRAVYDGYPHRRIDSLSTYYNYLDHLEDFGYVERKEEEDGHFTIALSPYGRTHGVATAGYLLEFSRNEEPPLRAIWEDEYVVDQTRRRILTPYGELSTKTYASALRLKLIRELTQRSRDKSLPRHFLRPGEIILPYNTKELAEMYGVSDTMVRNDLIGLKKAGLITYDLYEKGEPYSRFALADPSLLLSDAPPPDNGKQQGWFREAVWNYALRRGYDDLYADEGLSFLIDNYYGETIYGMSIDDTRDRIGKELNALAREGHLVQIGFDGRTKHGMLRLTPHNRRIMGNLCSILNDAQSRDSLKLHEGKRLASRIVRDRTWKSQLLDKARLSFDAADDRQLFQGAGS